MSRFEPLRIAIVFAALGLLGVAVLWRLVDLQILHGTGPRAALAKQKVDLPAPRGGLFDRFGGQLAWDRPVYEVRVTFEDQWKKEYALKYVLDLDVYFDLSVVEIYGVHHAAQALRGIEQKLERWSRYGDGLGVWVRDDDARMAELAAEVRAAIERSDGLTGSLHLDESEDESANPSEGGPSPTDAQGH